MLNDPTPALSERSWRSFMFAWGALRLSLFATSLVLVTSSSGCGGSQEGVEQSEEQALREGAIAITATSVERLNGSLDSVTPAVRTADPGRAPELYLRSESALGPLGPLGAWGPLGALGPVGRNAWNPSSWMSAAGDWRSWSEEMTNHGGPLSEAGPLGPRGPLGKNAYAALPRINDWSKQLQAGGVFTVLGPLGPLGALGPLGPLGPVGAHGFESNDAGEYRKSSGEVVRTIDVPYEASARTYELFEMYREAHAKAMRDNDTSFMVTGSIRESDEETDSYAFTSREEQFVTLVVVPENALSDFDLEVKLGSDVIRSTSSGRQTMTLFGLGVQAGYVDFVQLKAARGDKLEATVSAKTVNSVYPTYRLIVVGSTKDFTTTDIRGAHQIR